MCALKFKLHDGRVSSKCSTACDPNAAKIVNKEIREIKVYWLDQYDVIGLEFCDKNGTVIAGGKGSWTHTHYEEIKLKDNQRLIGFKAKYGNWLDSICFKIATFE